MTAPTRINLPSGGSPSSTAAHSSAQILDSAAALARAEVRLLWSHARRVGRRAAVALGLTWLSVLLTQTALLMLAASPMIFASYGSTVLIASVAPALVFTVVAWSVCLKKWVAVSSPSEVRAAEPPALELSSGELERR